MIGLMPKVIFGRNSLGKSPCNLMKYNYPLVIHCVYLFTLGTSISTIPTLACGDFYGTYKLLKVAKLSCKFDDDCIAVVDEGCDGHGPFKLCRKQKTTEAFENLICAESLMKIKGTENHLRLKYIAL